MTAPVGAGPRNSGRHRGVLGDYVAHPQHGPLPALLLVLTVATGVVDAVSILALGRVFIANMTGNVVFTGFALAGAPGFSLQAALLALAGFVVGASVGGSAVRRIPRRGRDRVGTAQPRRADRGELLGVQRPDAGGQRAHGQMVVVGHRQIALGGHG